MIKAIFDFDSFLSQIWRHYVDEIDTSPFQRQKLRHTLKSVGRKMQMDVFIISIFAENELNVTRNA